MSNLFMFVGFFITYFQTTTRLLLLLKWQKKINKVTHTHKDTQQTIKNVKCYFKSKIV